MITGTLFNIQKFSIHDGPGIRTTLFFKGCPMRCAWCHNPESFSLKPELLHNKEKCTLCGECAKNCVDGSITIKDNKLNINNQIFSGDENIIDECVNNALTIAGKIYTIEDALEEALKDKIFYEESGGGVTLSGGECLTQINFVEELLKRLKAGNIHTTIDTCGYVPTDYFKRIAPYTDLFLYDIKLIDRKAHKNFTGVDNSLIIENLKYLGSLKANIFLRLPIIIGVNATEEHIKNIITLLEENNINVEQVNLLPYHSIAAGKYDKLNLPYNKNAFSVPTSEELNKYKSILEEKNYSVIIGG
ncbi:glycyl-radical enzyme activating protein [Clostridium sp. DL1XJH146]